MGIDVTASFGGSRATYYRYELKNVMVTSYSVSGATQSDQRPVEQFSLNFEKIEWTYTELAHDGKPLADHRAYWDFVLNQGGSDRTRRGFKVSAGTEIGRNGVRLRWLAESGRKYRSLRSDLINSRFTQALPDVDSAGDIEQELWVPGEGPFGFFIITEVDPGGAP